VSMGLSRVGRTVTAPTPTEVAFDSSSACRRPNGNGCEPECCEAVVEF